MITGAEWFNDERFRLFTSAPYQRHLFSFFFFVERILLFSTSDDKEG